MVPRCHHDRVQNFTYLIDAQDSLRTLFEGCDDDVITDRIKRWHHDLQNDLEERGFSEADFGVCLDLEATNPDYAEVQCPWCMEGSKVGDVIPPSVYVTAVRLSRTSPFPKAKRALANIVNLMRAVGYAPLAKERCSLFATKKQADPLVDPIAVEIAEKHFEAAGRISPLLQTMALLPEYCQQFIETEKSIFTDTFPICQTESRLLGCISAARFYCTPEVALHEAHYLFQNGDSSLVGNLEIAPAAIQNLIPIIAILAHQPWKLTPQHLEAALNKPWSIRQLISLLVVAIWSITRACASSALNAPFDCDLQTLVEGCVIDRPADKDDSDERAENTTARKPMSSLADLLRGHAEDFIITENENISTKKTERKNDSVPEQSRISEGDMKFCANYRTCELEIEAEEHEDYSFEGPYPTIKLKSNSMSDDCDRMLKQFLSESAFHLQNVNALAVQFTDNSMQEREQIDPLPFKEAAYAYCLQLFGVVSPNHDKSVNYLLSRPIKTFLKTVATRPYNVTAAMINDLSYDFTLSEKVHLIVIAVEAKRQASLEFVARASSMLDEMA